jgi:uncharacterized protein (TIGR00730 family)
VSAAVARAICVFCGSSSGNDPAAVQLAASVGALLAERDLELVYGGGSTGLMGALADACLAAGGRVTGVIPTALFTREVTHRGLTELHEVPSMHERKTLMYDRSDGFVVLPGGLGTLEELAEAATWSQLGLHAKPVVLLDPSGFWQPLVDQLDAMVANELLRPENRLLVAVVHTPEGALEAIERFEPSTVEKWIGPAER